MKLSFRHINLERHPVLDAADTFLRTFGAAFFCNHPVSGILFIAGLAVVRPRLVLSGVLGAVSAQIAATLMRGDKSLLKIGFFTFNGALAGMYWTLLSPPGPVMYLVLVVSAGLTAPLMIALNRFLCLSRYNLPPLSIASLLLTYPSFFLLRHFRVAWPPTLVEPPGFDTMLSGDYMFSPDTWGALMSFFDMKIIAVIVLMFSGIAVHSRQTLWAAIRGLLAGIAAAYILGGKAGLTWTGLFLVNVVPVSIALDGFFLTPGPAARLTAFIASLATVPVWIATVKLFSRFHMPELTTPFVLTTLAALWLLHLRPVRRILKERLQPVPLVYVHSPATAQRWWDDLERSRRYWRIVAPKRHTRNWEGDMKSRINRAAELIMKHSSIAAFTGAGVSTESGIPDYRTGILHWKKYDTRHFTFERFAMSEESRAKYWEMSQDFYLLIKQARPNRAHLALAELEHIGKLRGIITQNVDRLHHKAGVSAEKIIELHGNELFVSCLNCGARYPREDVYNWILNGVRVPYCLECQGILKPDSIAFGQPQPLEVSRRALELALQCDLMIIMGTSLLVQPAALLPWKALENGADLLIINLSSTVYDPHADVIIRQPAAKAMGRIMDRIREAGRYIRT